MGEQWPPEGSHSDDDRLPRWLKLLVTLLLALILGLLGYLVAATESADKAPVFGAFGVVAGLLGGWLISGVDKLPLRSSFGTYLGRRWRGGAPYYDIEDLFGPRER